MKKIVLLALVLVLLSTAVVVGFIKPVSADGAIYIRADGSIEGTTDISTVDNVTYTFTDNIFNQSIVVERDNIVVDGAGHMVQGTGAWDSRGINLTGRNNITIKNMKIEAFYYGIWVEYSSNNTISGNTITANYWTGILITDSSNNTIDQNGITTNELRGIYLAESSNNIISGNTIENHNTSKSLFGHGIELMESSNNIISGNNITDNLYGIMFWHSENNTISGNDIINNGEDRGLGYNPAGVYLGQSFNNKIYHNNFADNFIQVYFTPGFPNVWDDGYPSGGNYWSDYTGEDANGDGIGDTPYVINENNQDRYPLMSPWGFEEKEEAVPFWMQWWLWAIVAVVIVALAGTVYFLKKRKPPTPTAPTPSTEGTLEDTQNTNPITI